MGEPSRSVCLHVIRHCMRWHWLHVPLTGEKVGDTGSQLSNSTVQGLFLLSSWYVAVVGRLSGL